MMICVISDDRYFSVGVTAAMDKLCTVHHYNPETILKISVNELDKYFYIVMNIRNRMLYRKVSLKLMRCKAEKIILLPHWNRLEPKFRRLFTPSKVTPAELRGLLMSETLCRQSTEKIALKASYFDIYQSIMEGDGYEFLAEINDITYKRIFYMKKIILQQLGLDKVNPGNIFLAESVFLGLQGRNQIEFTL